MPITVLIVINPSSADQTDETVVATIQLKRFARFCSSPHFDRISSQPRHATVFSGKPQINPGVLASRHVLQLNIQIFSAGIKQE